MTQASQLSPELARGVLQLAQALVGAARTRTLYPPEHPSVALSARRLSETIATAFGRAIISISITPDTLLVEGASADRTQQAVGDAARLLHDCDIIQLTFIGEVPRDAVDRLLNVLTLDPSERRSRGGPAVIWKDEGHPAIAVDQIDYQKVLEREQAAAEVPEAQKRDDVWRSLVLSIAAVGDHAQLDERAEQRLLAIAGSSLAVGDLALAVMEPKCAPDGSPMVTSQAAAVLAAFRHLTRIVSVKSPDRLPTVMTSLASAAATRLDPHVLMQVMQTPDDPNDQIAVVRGVASAFDDTKVAQLLATALALDGQASDRLATIFNTIAPDADRKRRVLTLTRNLLSETDFGRSGHFNVLWSSMEELLVSYNDRPFVSEGYRASLDGLGARAERLASTELPPELDEWMLSLGQENVRALSVQLLIDLLAIERDESRTASIADDMEALAEDLLMAGAYTDATTVMRTLALRAGQPKTVGRDACRRALDRLGESLAMRDTTALIGEADEFSWASIREIVALAGVASVESLRHVVMVETETPASTRAADLIVGFGAPAVSRLAPLVDDSRWFVQRMAARLLGRVGTPEAVPLLLPLVRRSDVRVARDAVTALGAIDDPAAARAIHTVLRTATGDRRRAVVEALVADRDPRVVPMLTRIVAESEPLGRDHDIVLDAVAAMGRVGSDQAVPALTSLILRRALFGRRKLRALKERGVEALKKIGGPKAATAIDDAATRGDRMLKKVIASRH